MPAFSTPAQAPTPAFLTVEAAAELLDLSLATIRRAIRAGDLPVHRFGRTVRISQDDFDAFVARSRR